MGSLDAAEKNAPSNRVAGPTGLEPATSGLTGLRANQLHHDPAVSFDGIYPPQNPMECSTGLAVSR